MLEMAGTYYLPKKTLALKWLHLKRDATLSENSKTNGVRIHNLLASNDATMFPKYTYWT